MDTTSVETSWPKLNTLLQSINFFNVDAYPTMEFVSTAITMNNTDTGKLMGNLTLLDQTHPVTLDFQINKITLRPNSKYLSVGITAKGIVK